MFQHQRFFTILLLWNFLTNYISWSTCLVIPQELPTVLSLIYSNIPTIKKGTDSRLGFGFRLGEHADFQFLIELGPQKETRPIGNVDSGDNGSSFSKRQANRLPHELTRKDVAATASWLEKWSHQAKLSLTRDNQNSTYMLYIPQRPVLPQQIMQQFQKLYKLATTTPGTTSTIAKEAVSLNTENAVNQISPAITKSMILERLKLLKLSNNLNDLQNLLQQEQKEEKSKTEITKELMDVNLDE